MLYLDTSLLVAVLTHEARTAEMQEWLAAQAVDELIVSDWVVTEFSSALSVKVRTAQLSPAHRAEALALFTSLVDASLTVLPVTRLDFRTAARFADQRETGLRAGDALHLAICANHGRRLQSLDGGLVHAAEALGIDATLL